MELSDEAILVVDLDGTLIKSDMLYETFWSALAINLFAPLGTLSSFFRGKSYLKHRLYQLSDVDVTTLPYNEAVLNYIRSYRANGGRVALVTASNENIAHSISKHLGIFDEVYGSSESNNLKGSKKAEFLNQRYGAYEYDYIGDANADLPVWACARKAITIDASPKLRKKVESSHTNVFHIGGKQNLIRESLRALRPHQWLKNILVFLPMLAAHQVSSPVVIQSLLAFIAFSLIASSVYVFNDLIDLNADRAHPRKKLRPFASGNIPLSYGIHIKILLLGAGLSFALYTSFSFFVLALIYFAITLGYSLILKRQPLIDIFTLAGLYTIRVIGGGLATSIEISFWLIAFSIFFFLSLAAIKRQGELVDLKMRGSKTILGRGYNIEDLMFVMMIATTSGFMSTLVICLYINSPSVLSLYSMPYALWGVCPIILFWINRMILITNNGKMHDDPIVFAVKDKLSHGCFMIIIVLVMIGTLS